MKIPKHKNSLFLMSVTSWCSACFVFVCLRAIICLAWWGLLQQENWFKPPMFFIDRTKAVIQHFLEKSFKKLKIENNFVLEKSDKHKK